MYVCVCVCVCVNILVISNGSIYLWIVRIQICKILATKYARYEKCTQFKKYAWFSVLNYNNQHKKC